jgi:hypothetical protein
LALSLTAIVADGLTFCTRFDKIVDIYCAL